MKKLLLLLIPTLFLLPEYGKAQVDTILRETFEPPDSVSTSFFGAPQDTVLWNDTNLVSISAPNSYHARVIPANTPFGTSEILFQTDSFSTVGYSFVFLEFYHICKTFQSNLGVIRISTDGGTTWTLIDAGNVTYLGNSPNWNGDFNEASYSLPGVYNFWEASQNTTPQNSWFQFEQFDISDLALGTNGTGFSDVRLEFATTYNVNPTTLPPAVQRPFQAGWFIDNLQITASTNCELFPPRFHFDYLGSSPGRGCYPVRPQGGLVEDPFGNNEYPIGARVTDSVPGGTTTTNSAGIDSVTVFYRVINTSGTGPWRDTNLVLTNATFSEYEGVLTNIMLGDTVEYYFKAWDKACPNFTRVPDSLANPQNPYYRFWPTPGFPRKCGLPDCGSQPGVISSFPWIEDFEGSEWGAGSGPGNSGTNHRGTFPNQQTGQNYWNVQPPNTATGYAWSIRGQNDETGTDFTGPSGNHTPGGLKYVYAEASQGGNNTTTTLTTPCIDLTQVSGCYALEFYYHFFGEDIGTMQIQIDTGTGQNVGFWGGYYFIRKEQQTKQSDPWRRALVDLSQFTGQYIRIRFVSAKQTSKTGNDIRGDMAIDDLRIFRPSQDDAEILEVVNPIPGDCSYANEDVGVIIRNYGCDSIKSLPLRYRLYTNGVAGTVQSHTATNLNLGTGDTIFYTIPGAVNMSALNNYQVEVWTNLAGDADASNDSAIADSLINAVPFSNFPLVMDFENVPVGSSQTGNNLFVARAGLDPDFKWTVGERLTPTRNTGPRWGHYRGGRYIYTEATQSNGNVNTYLETNNCVDFTGMNNPTLDFYYHMLGANIDELEVEVNEPAVDGPNVWNVVAGSTVSLAAAPQNSVMDPYAFKRVDLSAYANSEIRIRIVARRTGTGDLADIALDRIMLYDRIANDAGAEDALIVAFNGSTALALPADSTIQASFAPNILRGNAAVRNFGTAQNNNIGVTIAITPLCGPNAGVTTTYNSATSNSLSAGQGGRVTDPNMPLVLPKGLCEICAYTTLVGDNNNFNDTVCRTITGQGSFDLDFADNFDTCDFERSGFFAQRGLLQWERGIPDPNSRFGNNQGPNDGIWATNLSDGGYIDDTEEILRAPLLDNFDTIVNPTLRFFQNADMGSNAAGAVEVNLQGQWRSLGGRFQGVGQNWYTNSPMGTLSSPIPSIEEGFTGSSGSNNGGWLYSVYPMAELNFNPNAIPLRFRFVSSAGANQSGALEGWAIDDFEVIIPPQNSAAPLNYDFVSPLQVPTNDQSIDIVIENTGAKLLDSCEVKVEIRDPATGSLTWGGAWEPVTFPNFFIKGSRLRYRYQQVWPGNTVTSGDHQLCIITRRPNNKKDNLPIDDTLKVLVTVLSEFFYDSGLNDTTYCNDFEPSTTSLPWIALNSETFRPLNQSWELGTPIQWPGAFSGQNAWMTKLDSNYRIRDKSSLISPVFVLERDTIYELSFMHRYETERYHDGGVVEVSLDGGLSWSVVGFSEPQDSNWYNTEFVTALDIIKPGWTNISSGWDSASYTFRFDSTADRAVFRMRFESDYAIQSKGWAIDDLCLKMTDKSPQFFIGDPEYNPAPDTYVGELSPNPTRDVTNLPVFLGQAQNMSVNIVNVMGQTVFRKEYGLERGTNRLNFETFAWKPGVYFININISGKKLTRKLVVQ